MFNKIAIIGTGLMGGSLALALAEHGSAAELVAYDISAEARAAARELEIADAVTDTAAEAASGADLIFLATPIGAMVEALGEAAPAVEPGAIVSDLASAKMSLIKAPRGPLRRWPPDDRVRAVRCAQRARRPLPRPLLHTDSH
jgi:cyclohexadieny/prephenate dehydrogenase